MVLKVRNLRNGLCIAGAATVILHEIDIPPMVERNNLAFISAGTKERAPRQAAEKELGCLHFANSSPDSSVGDYAMQTVPMQAL